MTPLDAFAALLNCDRHARLPLLEAAAQLPLYADAACAPQAVLAQVQRWSEQLRQRIAPDTSRRNRLRLLNHFFFGELGFRGAAGDYYAPENSYLHRVIARRRGIPITLSLLYMELGRAIDLSLQGVSFPGHFLVRLKLNDGRVFVDVFAGGATLSFGELHKRLRASLRGDADLPLISYLRAADEREILARLLRNLKAIHWEAQDWPTALEIVHRLVALLPDAPRERLDRARLFAKLECPRAAAQDLVAYLALHPPAQEAAQARALLARLQQAAARLS